jgi:plasmid stability protein
MAQITVRKIPDEVHRALKAQAEQEGISAEAKARQILAEGLFPTDQPPLGKRLRAIARELEVDMEGIEFPRDRSGINGANFG